MIVIESELVVILSAATAFVILSAAKDLHLAVLST
jgi:hypothetical protein